MKQWKWEEHRGGITDEDYTLTGRRKEFHSLHQMMIILHNSMKICNEPYDYNLVFNKNKGDALLKGYEVFEPYGWYFEDEKERQVLDGTSELYRKEKKE